MSFLQQAAQQFLTEPADAGLRLDQVVMRHTGWSRRISRLAIHGGQVVVGGTPARIIARPLPVGVRLAVRPPHAGSDAAQGAAPSLGLTQTPPLRLLQHTRTWLAIDKPAGLLSEPDRFGSPSLLDKVTTLLSSLGERDLRLFLVHRLDAATTGVMVLARRSSVAQVFGDAFAQRHVQKVYLALCQGHLRGVHEVDAPLGRASGVRQAVRCDGRPASTQVRPRAYFGDTTLCEVRPHTGRTHQIRVHLAHLGHPIVGDRLYGGRLWTPARAPVLGLCLHAWRLSLPDPEDPKRRLKLVARPPQAFFNSAYAF